MMRKGKPGPKMTAGAGGGMGRIQKSAGAAGTKVKLK